MSLGGISKTAHKFYPFTREVNQIFVYRNQVCTKKIPVHRYRFPEIGAGVPLHVSTVGGDTEVLETEDEYTDNRERGKTRGVEDYAEWYESL